MRDWSPCDAEGHADISCEFKLNSLPSTVSSRIRDKTLIWTLSVFRVALVTPFCFLSVSYNSMLGHGQMSSPRSQSAFFTIITASCLHSQQLEAVSTALFLERTLGGFAKMLRANLAPLAQTTFIICLN